MKVLIVLAATFACALADNRACPHPDNAIMLVHEELVSVEGPEEGRQGVRIDVPQEVLEGHDVSCISVLSLDPESSPGYIGAGRNREGGISVIMNSKLQTPLEAIVYIYCSGHMDGGGDNEPKSETKVAHRVKGVKITNFKA